MFSNGYYKIGAVMETIVIEIPDGFMNADIDRKKHLLHADTNNSEDMRHFRLDLPKGYWEIYSVKGNVVTLQNMTT